MKDARIHRIPIGTDESEALKDAKILSHSLDEPLVFYKEDNQYFVIQVSKAIGHGISFEHEIINSR